MWYDSSGMKKSLALHCSILDIAWFFFCFFFSFIFLFLFFFFRYKNDYNVNCSRHDYLISQFTDKHFSQMNGNMRKPNTSSTQSGLEVIKLFNSAETKIYPAHKC